VRAGLRSLAAAGFPVEGLKFDETVAMRGLVVDVRLGSLLKVDRFGLVKRAMHGGRMLPPSEIRGVYGRDLVQLAQSARWVFLNTLFSVSEGCMYMQARGLSLLCSLMWISYLFKC
jgi:5'-nucleotidase